MSKYEDVRTEEVKKVAAHLDRRAEEICKDDNPFCLFCWVKAANEYVDSIIDDETG